MTELLRLAMKEDAMETYSIVRFYADINTPNEIIEEGLTLEQAQEHCNDPSTKEEGVWFDGYNEE